MPYNYFHKCCAKHHKTMTKEFSYFLRIPASDFLVFPDNDLIRDNLIKLRKNEKKRNISSISSSRISRNLLRNAKFRSQLE